MPILNLHFNFISRFIVPTENDNSLYHQYIEHVRMDEGRLARVSRSLTTGLLKHVIECNALKFKLFSLWRNLISYPFYKCTGDNRCTSRHSICSCFEDQVRVHNLLPRNYLVGFSPKL